MTHLTPTPGHTIGPFFHYALPYPGDRDLVAPGSPGSVLLHGVVRDGVGSGVPDALVEIWQAGPDGSVPRTAGSMRRDGSTFTGFGRSSTDRTGRFTFTTLPPGSVAGGLPFFAVAVFARGLTHRLLTRAYLPLDGATPDALLESVGPRAARMCCAREGTSLRFDIVLQGAEESVFLDHGGHSSP